MSSLPLCSPEYDRQAFVEAMNAIAPDMPLLMHGSGDVDPSQVNADTTALLSELTVQYVSQLVDAAVDAHDLLTDGAGGVLPPPSKRKRKQADTDYWDEPLPEPKIRSQQPGTSNSISMLPSSKVKENKDNCLLFGVDFWDTARCRKAYVGTTSAIGTQCFIFPICHDAGLYGRVMEVQAARRSIAPVLVDSVLIDMVTAEGGRLGSAAQTRPASAANDRENVDDAEEEDEDNNEEELLPTWPGLESILPIHRGE
jgi:hypothetical protein